MTEGEVARDLIRRGVYNLDYDVLNPDEQSTLIQIINFRINQWQSIFAQYELGLISQEFGSRQPIGSKLLMLSVVGVRFTVVTENMNHYLDSLPSDCEA